MNDIMLLSYRSKMFFSLDRLKTFEKVSKKMKDILEIFLQMLFFYIKNDHEML